MATRQEDIKLCREDVEFYETLAQSRPLTMDEQLRYDGVRAYLAWIDNPQRIAENRRKLIADIAASSKTQ